MSKNSNKSSAALYFLKIAGVLTLICSVVALMLAVINTVTKETIAANTEKEKIEAVSRIFGEIDGAYPVDSADHEIYLVVKNGEAAGYTVTVGPQGYGGEIEMLVGISPEKTVVGTQIVSMSETPGVGSRVKSDPTFLPQFEGRGETFVIGENVDAISGASISSKAVTAGINEALSVEFDIEAAMKAISSDTAADTAETEPAETESAPPETTPVVPPVTEAAAETEPETYIDPNSVGAGEQAYYNYPSDNITVVQRDTTYYLEHETTDTESETETETDENGNPIEPATDTAASEKA